MLSFDDLIPGKSSLSFDDLVPRKDPKIGQPEELSWMERNVAPVLDAIGMSDTGLAGKAGLSRSGAVGRAAMGLADPGVAVAQLAANATGQGDAVNRRIKEVEDQYQAGRGDQAGTFDPLRAGGNIGMTAFMAAAAPAVKLLDRAPAVVRAGTQGAGFGLLEPVTNGGGDYWTDKAKQAGVGAGAGAATSLLGGMLARVVSPNASTNADVQLLKGAGVKPTIGQTLGGWANTLEEKAQSLPFLGDRITAMRKQALEQFNEAAVNRAVEPIGATVNAGSGAGHRLVAGAGDLLSESYEKALGQVKSVKFDTPAFNQGLRDVQALSQDLSEPLQKKMADTFKNVVLRRMDSAGNMTGEAFKKTDSELGKLVGRYGRGGPAEQEFADAAGKLREILKAEVAASNPGVARLLARTDEGWANLVRVENAAKAAKNADGVFTPAQLNSAIQGADRSVRGRAVSRGEALMQDLGNAGQNVLGNKYPDSGTVGRALVAGLGMGAGAIHPAIPAALAVGAGAYTGPVQNALRALVSARPADAPRVANEIRRLMRYAPIAAVPAIEALTR